MTQNIVMGFTMAFWILGVISLVLATLIHEQFIKCVNPGSHSLQQESIEGIRSGDSGSIVRLWPNLDSFNEGRSDVAGWFGFSARLRAVRPFSETGAQRGLFESRLECDAEPERMRVIRTQKMILADLKNKAAWSGDKITSLMRVRPAVQPGAGAEVIGVVC
ncbi:MAG: hypothetical protein WBN92_00105 [Terriglobia bacterium]